MKIWGTYDSPEALVIKSKMPQMLKLIEEAEQKLKEDHTMEDFEMDLYGDDYNEEDYDYDWGYNEDEGFDPYAGCYTWDC